MRLVIPIRSERALNSIFYAEQALDRAGIEIESYTLLNDEGTPVKEVWVVDDLDLVEGDFKKFLRGFKIKDYGSRRSDFRNGERGE